MPQVEQLTAPPFSGCYRQQQPNAAIELAAEPVEFDLGGDSLSGDASIRIRFQPTDRMEIVCSVSRLSRLQRVSVGTTASTRLRPFEIRLFTATPHTHCQKGAEGDAWKLVLWLIEMAVLRLCNYNGRYSNRLVHKWAGQTELVPWAASSSSSS